MILGSRSFLCAFLAVCYHNEIIIRQFASEFMRSIHIFALNAYFVSSGVFVHFQRTVKPLKSQNYVFKVMLQKWKSQ